MIGQRIQAFDIVFEPAVGVNCFADIITTERGQRIAITAGPLVPQNARSGPEQSQIPVIPPIPAYAERVSDRKSTRLNSRHYCDSHMSSSACTKKTHQKQKKKYQLVTR